MRIVDIRHGVVPISRHADPGLPSGGLDTSIVAVVTDVAREGRRVVGYGFGSIGRYAQDGLIRNRFAPRLLAAGDTIASVDGANLDPFRAWKAMMAGEKPGGHGERCVAVGALDMALWDAAAKIAGKPLYRVLSEAVGSPLAAAPDVPVYAGGGYYYPAEDLARLSDEARRLRDMGYERLKIKIGALPLDLDRVRIEAAAAPLAAPHCLAVDAMNAYDGEAAVRAAAALSDAGLWWLEDICDPLDFDTLAAAAAGYARPLAAGEALFSAAEAMLIDRHGGLRRERDILVFDPVHCYGLPGYLRILELLEGLGWPRAAFWPHGGHLFCLHVVRAFGLGGAEVNPLCFQPFGGLPDGAAPSAGRAAPPEAPGVGFETKAALHALFRTLA